MTDKRRPISLAAAAAPLGVMLGLFIFGLTRLEMSTDLLILILLGAALVAGVIAVSRGRDWLDMAEISDPRLQQLAKDSVDLLSEEVTKMLDSDYREDDSSTPEPFGKRTELLRMPFHKHVDSDQWPKALDWSHSNMSALFDYGYKTGQAFCAEHAKRLENSMMSVA